MKTTAYKSASVMDRNYGEFGIHIYASGSSGRENGEKITQ
tara:strand:+ start:819 stop:938 length:120 start_codon:yes stop_codon:yes gene_type:complete